MEAEQESTCKDIFAGGGEMGKLMRSLDWSTTAVGEVETWPQSLKTAVRIILGSRYPMYIWWGQEMTNFYNDAYAPILGQRHPAALGQSAFDIWADIWEVIGPQAEAVLNKGESWWNKEFFLITERNGYQEETYFTFSYSPVTDDDGRPGGVFCACTEETKRVLGDRRLATLRELGAKTVAARTVEDACEISAKVLANNSYDVPFALLYLLDDNQEKARLVGTTGLDAGMPASPQEIVLGLDNDICTWSLATVLEKCESQLIDGLRSQFDLPGGAWAESPNSAMVLPLTTPGQTRLTGFLIAGISPRREFDDDYKGFFDLVAGQITTAVASANAYEAESKRAEALAEIDRAKTLFFTNISHEFRTPLTLMLSPTEDALSDTEDPLSTGQRDRIELVQRNGLRLLKLVNTLLDFSRIEAGRMQATFEPTDLATLTAELASVFRSTIEQAGMQFRVDCPTLPEAIYIDRELWEKIIFNLLSNAFKFTLSGTITVRLRWVETHAELTVEDTGVGIPPEELPNLFKRFHRVKNTQGRSFEGSGIGLALVQELVKLHGGTVSVTSIFGQGSCFTVSIKSGKMHLPENQIGAGQVASTTLTAMPFIEEVSSWKPEGGSQELLASPASATILLADDNADMREYIERLLSERYIVQAVADGIAALASVQENPPDLLLTDVMMPGMDGFELLRQLRTNSETQDIPIILLSARAGEEARIEGLEAGADDYLIKPFSARELLARIEATLKLAQLRRTAREQEQVLRLEAQTAQSNLQNVLSSLRDGFFTLDRNWCFTYINERHTEIIGMCREEVIGKSVWEIFPDLVGSEFYQKLERTMTEQTPTQFEYYYTTWNRWFENRVYPLDDGIALLCAEISDRKIAESEREQLLLREQAAREQAERANRVKDEFLAVLSHELRTPLNPILGWSRLLQNGRLNPAKTTEALATIERNAKLQVQLIDDLLDVSRILRGKLVLNAVPLGLSDVIFAAIDTIRLAASAKSQQITPRITPNVTVIGDTTRLQQVVWNLLSNAVKFTPQGGKIEVSLTCVDINAEIQVKDTGKGINPDFLPYVFEHFQQEDVSTTRKFGGLGLGLAIARQLVELHGGTVAVDSPGEGLGATFTVKIPLASDAIQTSAPLQLPNLSNLSGINILVVDDEPDSREFVAFTLAQEQANVTTAASGAEALLVFAQTVPDLLVSDIGMPEMNGYTLMRTIRASEQGKSIPAIALTAYAGEINEQQALEAGFQRHIAKPVDPNTVVAIALSLVRETR